MKGFGFVMREENGKENIAPVDEKYLFQRHGYFHFNMLWQCVQGL